MTNYIQTAPAVFQFQSQEIRVISSDINHPEFVAIDVAKALGFKDPTNAIKQHCKGVVKRHPLQTEGGEQNVRVIQEPDLYRLIFGSKLDSAQKFQDWVFEEVLPSIRKTGSYSIQNKDYALLAERVAELEDLVHILLQQRLATPKEQPLSDEDIHALTLQQWQANEDCKQFFLNIEILRVHHQLELNHSRDPEILAINLNQYMAVCDEFSLPNINILKLRRALKLNTRHLFLKATAVRSGVLLDSRGCGILMRCWLFRSKTGARRPRRRVVKMRGDNS